MEGLTRYAEGTFQPMSLPSGACCTFHRGCCVDREGRLWFGVGYYPGCPPTAYRWDGRRLDRITLPNPEGIGGSVFCIAADSKGDLWFGVWANLYRYDGERFHRVAGPSSPAGYIWSLLPRSDGSLWIGGSGGLFVYAEGRLEPLEEAIMGYLIMAFLEDSSGGAWLTTHEGQV